MNVRKLEGLITPVITPFKNGKIDSRSIAEVSEFLYKSGVAGVFPVGSTGAFPFLTMDEQIELIKEFADSVSGRLPLLPGVGRNSIKETIEVARSAMKFGASGVVIVTPYYIKLDDYSLFKYFDEIASAIAADIILYNIPQFSGNVINASVALKLAKKHKNIIGIKDSSASFRSIASLLNTMPKDFLIFQGQDDLLLQSLMIGASGGACGTTNFSDLAVRVYKEYKKGNIGNAKVYQEKLSKLMDTIADIPFPIAYNFLFNKIVMGRSETNAVPPIRSLSRSEGEVLYRNIKSIIK